MREEKESLSQGCITYYAILRTILFFLFFIVYVFWNLGIIYNIHKHLNRGGKSCDSSNSKRFGKRFWVLFRVWPVELKGCLDLKFLLCCFLNRDLIKEKYMYFSCSTAGGINRGGTLGLKKTFNFSWCSEKYLGLIFWWST